MNFERGVDGFPSILEVNLQVTRVGNAKPDKSRPSLYHWTLIDELQPELRKHEGVNFLSPIEIL